MTSRTYFLFFWANHALLVGIDLSASDTDPGDRSLPATKHTANTYTANTTVNQGRNASAWFTSNQIHGRKVLAIYTILNYIGK